MSIVAPTHRISRMVVGMAAAVGLLLLTILALRVGGGLPATAPNDSDRGPIQAVDQAPEQARWKVRIFPAGTGGRPSRSQIKAINRQIDAVQGTATTVYDALLLQPAALEAMSGKEVSKEAAAALTRSKLTPPADLEDLQTTDRRARIGIRANGVRHAAARFTVTAKGVVDGSKVRFRQKVTMWLERSGGRWTVVAFDGSQRPIR